MQNMAIKILHNITISIPIWNQKYSTVAKKHSEGKHKTSEDTFEVMQV